VQRGNIGILQNIKQWRKNCKKTYMGQQTLTHDPSDPFDPSPALIPIYIPDVFVITIWKKIKMA